MPSKHARLSASAANRWMHCPGSVKLSDLFPQGSTEYADEGTIAHSMAEHMIGGTKTMKELVEDVRKAQDFYEKSSLDGNATEMEHYISTYAEYVSEQYAAEKHIDPASQLYTEMQVSMEDYIPGGFGTSDVVIIRDGFLHVIDLKYGKGVPVEAEGNPQLRLYALGVLSELSLIYPVNRVQMTIYQPRLDNISSAEMTAEELTAWGEEEVRPAAKLALTDDAPFHAGDWCRFCPARARCKERAKIFDDMIEYQKLNTLSSREVADILGRVDMLLKWADDVKTMALKEALDGEIFPGWKLVAGRRGNRRYAVSDDQIAETAIKAGFQREMLFESKLLSVTQMEKMMGKKKFQEVLGSSVETPEGKPTLVPDTDKREPLDITNAKDDFADD